MWCITRFGLHAILWSIWTAAWMFKMLSYGSIRALLYVLTGVMLQVCCVGSSECVIMYSALLSSVS
jgi:hypothetical protein